MGLFSNLFTWWHGPGMGTVLFTRGASEAGRDDQGNIYYRRGQRGG